MSERFDIARWSPLTGVLTVVLWVAGVIVAESGGMVEENASAAEVLAFYEENTSAILIGGSLFSLGCLAFLLFLGMLRDRLTAADGGDRGPATFAFGIGLVAAVFLLATQAPDLALGIETEGASSVEPAAAQAMSFAGDGFFVLAAFTTGLFLFAVAAVAIRTGALAKWIAWLGVAIGIVMLVPPIGWAGLIFAFPVWILITSVVLVMHRLELPTVHRAAPA